MILYIFPFCFYLAGLFEQFPYCAPTYLAGILQHYGSPKARSFCINDNALLLDATGSRHGIGEMLETKELFYLLTKITCFCVLVVVSSVRSMPVSNVEETTEWTHDITTEEAMVTTWPAPESLTEEMLDAAVAVSPDDNSPVTTTTEEPVNAVTDHDEPTVWSPSQTVEVRLHPQSLRTEDVKPGEEELRTTSTTAATSSVAPVQEDVFGQRTAMKQQQQQQQHGSFSGLTGRLRSRDSVGAALRRAVTGSPAVQKLQQSTTRMASLPVSSGRGKAGGITGRKIVGFGSLSNLPSIQRVPPKSFFKNRQAGHGHGGDTPADTHMEPSPQWLYGTSKDTRKAVESFRLSNNERLLVLGLRDKVMSTTVANQEAEIVASTTSKPEEAASTTTTTTLQPPVSEQQMPVTETGVVMESTTTRPAIAESVTQDVPMQTSDATPERNDAIPEINNETSERTIAEGHVTSTELVSALTASSTESNPFTSSKTKFDPIPLDEKAEPIKSLDNSPIDGQTSSKQELGSLPANDECFGADCNGDEETGLNMGQLDHGGFDEEAHRYLVEEKTHDGYIIGEFGVVSRSSDLRAVRYTAHGSIDPQLIQEMLRTFWLLKTGEKNLDVVTGVLVQVNCSSWLYLKTVTSLGICVSNKPVIC
ncbi:hypothetical protein GHT06_017475 [Daphnia sinensis]|uniref:Uncharacterized protein n=1 Tax=Daphnia sinensis TaxID=1820382 RepID=A0AAD5KRJ7_9CRUS|nr:hypothetical protein GHT06_017475 [Daphnia sinensis]